MKQFLKLTTPTLKTEVYIDPEHVQMIHADGPGTKVYIAGKLEPVYVIESIPEINSQLKDLD